MIKRLVALLGLLLICQPAFAQVATPGVGWNQGGQVVTNDMPFITTSNQPMMSNERALTVGSGLTTTDNGANSSFVIGLGSVLSYFHGTGATSQQAAANAILNFPSVTAQDTIKFDGTNWVRIPKGSTGQVLGIDGGGNLTYISPAGSGTVTSVGLTMPAWLTVGGSPVTGSGTLAVSNGTGLTANRVVGTDGSGNLDLMAMTAAQVPSLDASKITTGNLAKAQHATTAVFNDQSNTYSGTATQDMSAATQTLLVPLRAAPATNGAISVNSADLEFRASGATHKAAKQAVTISTGTGLTGGGDLSANRTISLSTPVAETNGGTGQGTWTTGQMLVATGTNTLGKLSIGSNGQVLTVVSGSPAWAASASGGLYGDGSDGAVTKGAVTETTVIQVNATTFTQSVSTTYAPISRTQIKATSTCDFNGTTNVATGNPGSPAVTASSSLAQRGIGLSGGFSGSSGVQNGGAGGGFGGAGGVGGNGGVVSGGNDDYWEGPSGGGNGAFVSSGTGGAGGNAGGSFAALASGALSVGASGTINADGQAGAAGVTSSAGGGGGSGGVICLYSGTSITLNTGANVFARGGAGGNGAGGQAGGGGGGGGKVVRVAPSITGAGTVTVTGGAAGTGGTPAATAGSTGVNLSITDTPTFMLTQELRKPHIDSLYHYHVAFGDIQPGAELRLPSSRPAAIYCASFYPKEQREAIVHEMMFGEDLNGGKVVQIKREDIADAA